MTPPEDLVLRPASREDLPALGALHTRARAAAVPAMPASVHTPEEDLAWAQRWDLATEEVWVAERDGTILGYARSTATWLEDLYVEPTAQRDGIGTALLELVMARRPDGFGLWVFASNLPARELYRRHGFVETRRTDGSENEEKAPDIALAWPGVSDTVDAGCRRRVSGSGPTAT